MRRYPFVLAALLALTAALLLWRWQPWPGADNAASIDAPPLQVRSAKVLTRAVELTSNDRLFEAIGTGRARQSVQIYPAVAGEVVELGFAAGQRVDRGQLLLRLDERQQHLAVRLAEVELTNAKNLLRRYEQAVTDGAVPESEVDSARATVSAAEVALAQARLALEDRRVVAPFAGNVGIPNVDVGDRVDTSTLITGLDDRGMLYVDFEIPESLTGLLREAGADSAIVTATSPAWPAREFNAAISALEARLDPARRTLMVRAGINNDEDLLRPGMSFSIRWRIPGQRYPTVPEIALQWSAEGAFVWVVRDGRAEREPARVVARSDGRVLVEAAMQAGEAAVVEGQQRLRPGLMVEVLDTHGGPGA